MMNSVNQYECFRDITRFFIDEFLVSTMIEDPMLNLRRQTFTGEKMSFYRNASHDTEHTNIKQE